MALERVVLHAGLPKTGTSAIQDFLFANRDSLARHGVCYPAPSTGPATVHPNHRFLIEELRANDAIPLTRQALREAEAEGCSVVLFSIEGLTGHSDAIRREAARALIEAMAGAAVQIVIVVRDPDSWLVSMYRQSIINPQLNKISKSHLEKTYETGETFTQFAARPEIRNICDGDKVRERMQDLFPSADIHMIEYDDDIVSSFAHLVGLKEYVTSSEIPRSNIMPSDPYLELLRQMNAKLAGTATLELLRCLVSASCGHSHAQLAMHRAPPVPQRLLSGLHLLGSLTQTEPVANEPLRVDDASLAAAVVDIRTRAWRSLWHNPGRS